MFQQQWGADTVGLRIGFSVFSARQDSGLCEPHRRALVGDGGQGSAPSPTVPSTATGRAASCSMNSSKISQTGKDKAHRTSLNCGT